MIKKTFALTLLLTSTLGLQAQFESRNSLEVNFANLSPFGYNVLDERRDLTLSNFATGPEASLVFNFHLTKSIHIGLSYNYFSFNSLDSNPASVQIDEISLNGHGLGLSTKYVVPLKSRFQPFIRAEFGAESHKVSHGVLIYNLFEPIIGFVNNGERVFIQDVQITRPAREINGVNAHARALLGISYRFTKNTSAQLSYGLKMQFFAEDFYLENRQSASQIQFGIILSLNRKDFL